MLSLLLLPPSHVDLASSCHKKDHHDYNLIPSPNSSPLTLALMQNLPWSCVQPYSKPYSNPIGNYTDGYSSTILVMSLGNIAFELGHADQVKIQAAR